jgi:hypothetical protein
VRVPVLVPLLDEHGVVEKLFQSTIRVAERSAEKP